MKRRTSRKQRSRKSSTKFRNALLRLKKLKPHHQSEAMKMANNGFVREMCSHVKKLRHAKIEGNRSSALKRHATKLRSLANSKIAISKKRKILSQRGGFLPLLIPAITSVLGSLAGVVRGR